MKTLAPLLARNRAWSEGLRRRDPEFFSKLSRQQSPEYLWIGCSDSRVPANQITGLNPGEVFVHRNIANVIVHTDLNCLSVVHYAIEVLRVQHLIVCGHYGCGGVGKVIRCERVGLADNWLRHVQDVRDKHNECLCMLRDDTARSAKLCELNVIEQVANVCSTTIVQDAWTRGQDLTVHGWIYGLKDGLLRDLKTSAGSAKEAAAACAASVAALTT